MDYIPEDDIMMTQAESTYNKYMWFQSIAGDTPRGKKAGSDKTDLGQERRCIYHFALVHYSRTS